MRLIDADALKEKLIKERDAIPLTKTERYGFGVEFPDPHGTSMRGGINKAFRCMEQTPTIDAVVLPCKIGETVFCIAHSKREVVEDVVEDYDIWSIKNGVKLRISLLNHNDYVVAEFGKTVFLTREAAEAALAERVKKDA